LVIQLPASTIDVVLLETIKEGMTPDQLSVIKTYGMLFV
jgi:hypothetical protein